MANEELQEASESTKAVMLTDGFIITNDGQLAAAQETLIYVTERQKTLAEKLKFLLAPFRKGIDRFNAELKPDVDNWTQASAILRTKIAAYNQARLAERAAQAQQARELHASGAPVAEVQALVLAGAEPAPESVAGVGMRAKWKAQVTDLVALLRAVVAGDVPLGAVIADMRYLDKEARATKGPSTIPGVTFVNEGSVTVRAPKG